MSLKNLKDRYQEILAIGLFNREPGEYLEEFEMEKYVNSTGLSQILSDMEERSGLETIIIEEDHTLFIIRLREKLFLTCVAPSSKPFGYCRNILHRIVDEIS